MAWNTPGNNDEQKSPRRKKTGKGSGSGFDLGDVINRIFDNGPWKLIGIALILFLAYNCFVLVAEQQRGVVLRFGMYARTLQPGPHFKLPWPIERVRKVDATGIRNYTETVPILTSDENIVNVEINVQYRVSDPEQFLFGTRDATQMLEQAALSTVREQVGRTNLDTVLGAREALAVSAKERLQRSLQAYRTGLVVTELNLPNARPPDEVKPAFDDVNSAQQDKDRLTSEAQAYAAKIVPEARGQANRIRTVSEGTKTASIARATGDAERFSLLVDQYQNAPEVTRKRLWLETVQSVMSENRKIVGDGRQILYAPIGNQTSAGVQATLPQVVSEEVMATPSESSNGSSSVRPARAPRKTGE